MWHPSPVVQLHLEAGPGEEDAGVSVAQTRSLIGHRVGAERRRGQRRLADPEQHSEVSFYNWISPRFHWQWWGANTLRWDGERGPEVGPWILLPGRVSRERHEARELPGSEPPVSRDRLGSFPDCRLRQAREIGLARSRDKPLGVTSRRG